MTNSHVILQVNNLCKEFKSGGRTLRAVDDVSFHVKKGETLALVGESGCGKTTTGRLIVKLLDADSGEILFHGNDILKMSRQQFKQHRSAIQIIFQDPYGSLNPRMRVRKLLEEAVLCNPNRKANVQSAIEELIQSVGLQIEDLDKYPHEFSGGQRQRICIARAIATDPELIICDEAVSALDLLVQAQILKLLKELQEKYGFSYIFISHNLSVVRYMSDRIAVMCMGRIVEEGCAEEIFAEPGHCYTKLLLDSVLNFENKTAENDIDQSYFGDKYQQAIDAVKHQSGKINRLSETHYVLCDI